MRMYIGGEWVDGDEKNEVINPYDGSVIDTVPSAGLENLDMAIDWTMRFAKEVDSGNLHINSGPAWRADLMPYGGLKESGMGKEGPKYAVQEMTELKMVVFHP